MAEESRVTFIGVPNPASADSEIDEWIAETSPAISHVREDLIEVWQQYDVISQPAFVFIGADGSIEKHAGSGGSTGLLWRVQDLIDPAIRGAT